MEIRCDSEATRLHLYHLALLYFHERAEDLCISCAAEDSLRLVTVSLGKKRAVGKAAVTLSLHKEKARAENAALGKAFAEASHTLTDYRPPYGILFGVRPVKVPLFYLNSGLTPSETQNLLQTEYFVSPEKADLLMGLSQKEMAFSATLGPKDAMLYLSIPFCPSRCRYCSFISSAAPDHLALIPQYVEALQSEIALTGALFAKSGRRLRGVYMGGGTPGILSAEQMNEILGAVKAHFDLASLGEFCVEIGRPDTVTEQKLSVLREAGVTRISINPQTTSDATLRRIGRGHSAEEFFSAMEKARPFAFDSVNCDLIAGLEGEGPEDFLTSLEDVLSLAPQEVTLHALCRKRSAESARLSHDHTLWQAAMSTAHKACINRGLDPYYLYRQKNATADLENTGFAAGGKTGVYNLAMMEDLCDIFSCGAGGIAKIVPKKAGERILRFAAFKYPFEYLSCPERSKERLQEMSRYL